MMNNSEKIIGLINDAAATYPELLHIGAVPLSKTKYKTVVATTLPTASFRENNVGIANTKPNFETVEVECKFLDASFSIDEKTTMESEWGQEFVITEHAKLSLQAAFQKIAAQTWYGTVADAGGFPGIAQMLPYKDSKMVVNATGTTANKATSIFAIRSELQGVQYAWGQNGRIEEGPTVRCEQYDANLAKFWGYSKSISGYVGLQIPTVSCVGRICNITTQDGKTATDNLVANLLELFPIGLKPNMLFMSQQSLGQIRASRIATNQVGEAAPYPDSIFGIPVYVTDAIKNTEAILAAAP
jgi:hypothetical protein